MKVCHLVIVCLLQSNIYFIIFSVPMPVLQAQASKHHTVLVGISDELVAIDSEPDVDNIIILIQYQRAAYHPVSLNGLFHFTIGIKTDFINENCLVPGKDGKVLSRKGMTLDRKEFENMKEEYYRLRNWDVVTGLPTRSSLEALDLKEVADGLEKEGLLGGG